MIYSIHSETGLFAEISSLGAELVALKNDLTDTDYLWTGDPVYWKRHAPILFPFVGRLTDGVYRYSGKTYSMSIHGYVSHREFQLVEQTDNSIVLSFSQNAEDRINYPFDYDFIASYILSNDLLEISYKVVNKGYELMHYGIGSHSGFCVPLNSCLSFNEYYLSFPNHADNLKRVVMSDDCYITSDRDILLIEKDRLPLTHSLFDNDAIVLEYSGQVVLRPDKDEKSIVVDSPETKFLGLWHVPHTEAGYICIEPWYSLPAEKGKITEIENEEYFFHILPGESKAHKYSIQVR